MLACHTKIDDFFGIFGFLDDPTPREPLMSWKKLINLIGISIEQFSVKELSNALVSISTNGVILVFWFRRVYQSREEKNASPETLDL